MIPMSREKRAENSSAGQSDIVAIVIWTLVKQDDINSTVPSNEVSLYLYYVLAFVSLHVFMIQIMLALFVSV